MTLGLKIPILYRYVFREIATPFFISLFVFTGILFLARILRLLDLVISKNVPIGDVLLLFSFIIPRFLELAIPMSLLLGVLVAFGRLSADSELVVLRASGVSLRRLAIPVLAFAITAFLGTMLMSTIVRPWSNYRLGVGIFEIAKKSTSAALIPGMFNELGPLTIYAETISNDTGKLENVIISDGRDPEQTSKFIAPDGRLVADDSARTLTLRLYNGSIHQGAGLNYNLTDFDVNNINLNFSDLENEGEARKGKKKSEMFIWELRQAASDVKPVNGELSKEDKRSLGRTMVELHRRFAVPVSCLCIAFVAMALGIQPSRGGASWGLAVNITVGILLIVFYYLFLALMSALSRNNPSSAAIFMWIPNIVVGVGAYGCFRMMDKEKWLSISQSLGDLFAKLARKINPTTAPEPQDVQTSGADA